MWLLLIITKNQTHQTRGNRPAHCTAFNDWTGRPQQPWVEQSDSCAALLSHHDYRQKYKIPQPTFSVSIRVALPNWRREAETFTLPTGPVSGGRPRRRPSGLLPGAGGTDNGFPQKYNSESSGSSAPATAATVTVHRTGHLHPHSCVSAGTARPARAAWPA